MDQHLGSSTRDVLNPPIPGDHGLTTQERLAADHSAAIPGWGSDLEPARRPGVPYDKAPQLGAEHLYPPFPRQEPRFTIFKSTEHGKLTPVFGTSCPPGGLSGVLRAIAYRFSEGRLSRWLTLLVADRVNVVEGIASDLARGHIPNVPREMGLATEWRYNREAFVKKVAIGAGIATVLVLAWRAHSRRS
jgi:hypothetical protein